MSLTIPFPELAGWEPTRETLHWVARAVGVVPRTLLEAHPRWWHSSLTVQPTGLVTKDIPLPTGGTFHLAMDLLRHEIALVAREEVVRTFDMTAGLSAAAMGDQILAAVAGLGLVDDFGRETFDNSEARVYDPWAAGRFLTVLINASAIFARHRATLVGELGPIQLWPHGFDLAFEWFGTRMVEYEEQGEIKRYPSQLNLGFSPGEASHPAPYFYSNPWPFEAEMLLSRELPPGARWFTESWQGTILPYAELAGQPDAGERLFAYAQAVYAIAAPTLLARD